jgi:glycyl-tRNA synthetase
VKPKMKRFGPLFKGDAPKILAAIKNIEASDIQKSFQEEGLFKLEIEGKLYELTPDLIGFEDHEETVRGKKVIPHVIEPSYGIDRIIYSVLLHSYTENDDRIYLKLDKRIAPIGVSVFPLVNKAELVETAHTIRDEFRNYGVISEYDGSGTIGRRYARADEIGVPFAVTVDHETLENQTVTIRNRDDLKQVRIPIKDIYGVLIDLLEGKIEFENI